MKLYNHIKNKDLYEDGQLMTVFAIFGIINYPIFHILWSLFTKNEMEQLTLRIIAAFFCLGLLVRNYWPEKLKKFLLWYWYFTVLYCLPFFCTYMFLLNHGSNTWLINAVLATFLLIMILDWLSFTIISIFGILLGTIFYIVIFGKIEVSADNLLITLINIAWTILVCIFFSYNRHAKLKEKSIYLDRAEKLNQELEEKIAERTAELEKALAVRTEILNNVNHEIRTPLHGFSIIAKELANNWDDFSNKKRKLLASQVSSNVIRLEKLIYNLLDLSILSNGKTILHYEVTDFNNLISAMIEESKALYMGDKQIEIIYLTDDKLTVNIDQEKINQVLRNLIINAIRFSPPQAKIIIKAEISDDNLHFYIKDHGLGVPEEELETIFNIFTQSSRTKTGAGGTGLGLSICKKIIESHQGKIWAENNIDIGTAFHFVIPRNIEEEKRERKEKRNAIILMIDDEEICHMGMELLLKDSGYKLHKTSSGEEGKIIIEKEKIDLILLDIMMPEVNGIEFLKELRASGNEIPVIMQSGAVNAEEMLEGLEIAGLITKPYKKEKVINIIDDVIGSMKDSAI